MDKETRSEFDRQQAKRDKPECFGNWKSSAKCSHCWFHPDCKLEDPKKIAKEKAAAEKKAKKEAAAKEKADAEEAEAKKLDALKIDLDNLEIKYDPDASFADLEKLLNEAMK